MDELEIEALAALATSALGAKPPVDRGAADQAIFLSVQFLTDGKATSGKLEPGVFVCLSEISPRITCRRLVFHECCGELDSPLRRHDAGEGRFCVQAGRPEQHERVLAIYTNDAAEYTIYRDASRKERVELRREPVFVCSDPTRGGGDGAVFVWTCRGRAEVIGIFFSFPTTGPRKLYHEFHSLSLSVLDVSRSGTHASTWTPLAPGIEMAAVTGAPRPARSAPQRLSQMRALARDFSASTKDQTDKRLELRLLAQPLYRYESTDPVVLDGAVFAFVTSTDPEAILVIEARQPAPADGPVWDYAVCRFTDLDLRVRHKGKEVFSAPLIPYDSVQQDPKHRYRVYSRPGHTCYRGDKGAMSRREVRSQNSVFFGMLSLNLPWFKCG